LSNQRLSFHHNYRCILQNIFFLFCTCLSVAKWWCYEMILFLSTMRYFTTIIILISPSFVSSFVSQKKALHTCTSSYSPCKLPQTRETSSRNSVPVRLPTISPSPVATFPARDVTLSTVETVSSISRCRLPRSVSRSTPADL